MGGAHGVLADLDDKIAKLTQLRGLLADPAVSALVAEIIQGPLAFASLKTPGNFGQPGSSRSMVDAAYRCVIEMDDEPFTKSDLAECLRRAGHACENPKTALHYSIQRLLAHRVINLVEHGGAQRPNKYQKASGLGSMTEPSLLAVGNAAELAGPVPTSPLPKNIRRGNTMLSAAFRCIQGLDRPFAPHELIRMMREAGYTFAGNADLSIQPVLTKLIKEGVIEVADEGEGGQTKTYRRRKEVEGTVHVS